MTLDRRHLMASGAAGLALAGCASLRGSPRSLRVVLLGQALIEHAPTASEWPGRPAIAARLASADSVFTNLETVIQGPRAGAPTRDLLTLHAAGPEILEALKSVDVNLLTTANNHTFDLGSGGILDTLVALRATGLPSSGSGANLAEASAPAFVDTAAGRVAVVGFATGKVREGGMATEVRPGVNELRRDADGTLHAGDEARVMEAIRQAAATARLVIACHHNHDWEADNSLVPPWQQALARRCVDAGADVFAGHGSPLPQGMGLHRGKPLLYGLGNFIFQTEKVAGSYPPEAWTSVIVHLERRADGRIETMLQPIAMNETGLGGADDLETRGFPRLADSEQAAEILARIDRLSRPLGGRIQSGADGGHLRAGNALQPD